MKRLFLVVALVFSGLLAPALSEAQTRPSWLNLRDRPTMDVRDFGAKLDGATDDAAAVNAAIASMPVASVLVFPKGYMLLKSEILLPYTTASGSGKVLQFEDTQLVAGTGSMNLIHWADSYGGMRGNVTFNSGGYPGCTGLRISPQTETATNTVVNQNFNFFDAHMTFAGLDEAIVMMTGPDVASADSGCYFNTFSAPIYITSCKRGVWIKDNSAAADDRSGTNANTFIGGLVINGSMNTGIQIDGGGGNVFYSPLFENITLGTSPNATPTGIIVANTMANGAANPSNSFYNAHWENVTRRAVINNALTIVSATEEDVFNANGDITAFLPIRSSAIAAKGGIISALYGFFVDQAKIRSLWLFDEFTSTASIIDRSGNSNTLFLKNALLGAKNADEWGPRMSGVAYGLTYGDVSHLWTVNDAASLTFSTGGVDASFTFATLCYPTLATDSEVIAKDSLAGATAREYSFAVTKAGAINCYLFDNSAGSYIARTSANAAVSSNTFHVLAVTYSGSGAASGIKIYVDGSRVDSSDVTSGAYTSMDDTAADVSGFRPDSAGGYPRVFHGRLYLTLMAAEALTDLQMVRMSILLRSYAGTTLTP